MSSDQNDAYDLDSSTSYPFVANSKEHDRLNEQTVGLTELMFGTFSHAPVKKPSKILDVGCGTGLQTRLFAELYPEATVIGIDPNPVPDAHLMPGNAKFILGHIEEVAAKHELLQPASFDVIYQRMLVMAIKSNDWKRHMAQMQELLRPGGWIEFQEMDVLNIYDEQEKVVSDAQVTRIMRRAPADYGVDFEIFSKLPDLCRQLGLVDVSVKTFPLAWRPGWMARPQSEKIGTYLHWSAPAIYRLIISRSARLEEGEDVEKIHHKAMEDRVDAPIGHYSKFYVTIARRSV